MRRAHHDPLTSLMLTHTSGSGAVLGWFDCQVACWFAAEERQAGLEVEVGYSWRGLRPPGRAGRAERQPRADPEAGA